MSAAITALCMFVDCDDCSKPISCRNRSTAGSRLLVACARFPRSWGKGLLAVALGKLPATFSSLVIFLEAIGAAALGWLVLNEALGPAAISRRHSYSCRHLGGAAARKSTGSSIVNAKRELLTRIYDAAVARAHPAHCLPPHLPEPPGNGRLMIFAAGKAAGSMAQAAEDFYLDKHRLPNEK